MDWVAEIAFAWDYIKNIYHAGGARVRWVLWFWCAFIFLYIVLGKYDSIHKKNILNHRKKIEKNYFYALHMFGVLTIVIEYGYLLEGWDVFIPIVREKMLGCAVAAGFGLLFLGFVFVLLGRLYLNSFWGKDIYEYNKNDYKLVRENVYGICRHPIYFGQVCMCLGTAFELNNWIIFGLAILMIIMNVYRALREDRWLQEFFGSEWEEYKNKVNFFMPFP